MQSRGPNAGVSLELVGERRSERIAVQVPVRVDDGLEGVTRDVSATGIYFVVDAAPKPGSTIRFTVEFAGSDTALFLECKGEIVRVDTREGHVGIAATIAESRLDRRNSVQLNEGERK